jgi:hypothetical protein
VEEEPGVPEPDKFAQIQLARTIKVVQKKIEEKKTVIKKKKYKSHRVTSTEVGQ